MLLCIDVGNTQIALGLYPDVPGDVVRPELVHDWRMRTDSRMTADELEVAIRGLLGEHAAHVTGIAALSTVPALLRELRLLLDRGGSRIPAVVVGPGVRTGVPLLVDNPREVGADRVVNTLAAHRLFGTACIVVDFGTSTNIDVVSGRGEFLGGALAPGIEISLEALATRAAALRTVELVRPRSVIGKNTVECLQSGVLYGFAGQVDGLVGRILDELGPKAGPVTVLATGGLAPLMEGESSTITQFVPDLTLIGLRLTYLRNIGGAAVRNGANPVPAARVSGRVAR
ncbi:type III pantothenate kinase [Pseudonocardia asaccharolytica]|uniref:Type III pantothenate kinase n=1 Tax=Pseudonocardia asaccharolytica DSM 44247 = NBRC 16224 TaxID=1123024 RepID=A0A511CY24_9PSEU|nr:type III pantothenate kinase [Pseudonocardia asaccharolytica]GEL17452.1 type III pantothenate kinase [Pseudonocardia asaccharolytica DSM 44247 = NBRC 16224]